jgi:hypothetical protein
MSALVLSVSKRVTVLLSEEPGHAGEAMPRRLVAVAVLIVVSLAGTAMGQQIEPDQISGLVAWYRAASLGLSNDEPVELWKDDSGNGHDLTSDDNGLPALYQASALNGSATVLVRKYNSYSVATPFSLTDHTIAIVYAPGGPDAALLRSETNNYAGILLRADGQFEQLRLDARQSFSYGAPTPLVRDFGITVLGRESGRLMSFVNGTDVSAGNSSTESLRVGKLFDLYQTRAVHNSGDQLRIAALLFFDRYLNDEERNGLTAYLVGRYGLESVSDQETTAAELTESARYGLLAQFSTTFDSNINDATVTIPWDAVDELDVPFAHDRSSHPERLRCTRNDVRVRLYVSLPLVSSVVDAGIRLFFRINGERQLRGERRSTPFSGNPPILRSEVGLEVITVLHEGDYVEVVAARDGVDGEVKILPGQAVFVAEVK